MCEAEGWRGVIEDRRFGREQGESCVMERAERGGVGTWYVCVLRSFSLDLRYYHFYTLLTDAYRDLLFNS